MEVREQRPVPYLQVCFVLIRETFCCSVVKWSESHRRFCCDCHTGTGSDVKAPKKPERPRPSHTLNHGSRVHKHSSANQNETGADSRHSSTNIPALRDGSTSPSSKDSQVKLNIPTGSQSTIENGVGVEPNISANTQPTGQNNRDWGADTPAVKDSNSSHQHRDKDSALTSPQKHREKRKHCKSSDSDKHKKRKHTKDARFEGHRISHLVKKRTFNKEEIGANEGDEQKKSDDYVLAKLFKKSGRPISHIRCGLLNKIMSCFVDFFFASLPPLSPSGIHSVMQHDTIMESSNPDYVLVEAEANRVAKDAMKALKVSRQQCRLPYNRPPPPPARYTLGLFTALSSHLKQTCLTVPRLLSQETVRTKEEFSPGCTCCSACLYFEQMQGNSVVVMKEMQSNYWNYFMFVMPFCVN